MEQNVREIHRVLVLSGLLHDIGKFWQRADPNTFDRSTILSKEVKKLVDQVCPVRGNYTHLHVLWTAQFLEMLEEKKLLPEFITREKERLFSILQRTANNHHKVSESDPFQVIIQEADHLSAGSDRVKAYEEPGEQHMRFKKIPLQSLFQWINISHLKGEKQQKDGELPYQYELEPLKNSGSLIPYQINAEQELTVKYGKLWTKFEEEVQSLANWTGSPFWHYLNALKSILYNYTWCIPSSTIDQPDIPLYDHLRSTAAFASCLYQYHQESGTLKREAIKDDQEKKYLLILGDISGIQAYLYQFRKVAIRKLSKILRARSFFLTQLVAGISEIIISELDLFTPNILTGAGGQFMILAPNTGRVKRKLKQIQAEIEHWFHREFMGELMLHINWDLELSSDDFKVEKFRETCDRVRERMEWQKKRPFATLERSESFFQLEADYSNRACVTCGRYPGEKPVEEAEEEVERGEFRCQHCHWQTEIGKFLTKAKYISIERSEERGKHTLPLPLGYRIILTEGKPNIHQDLIASYSLRVESDYPVTFLANYIPRLTKEHLEWREQLRVAGILQKGEEEQLNRDVGSPVTFFELSLSKENFDSISENGKVEYRGQNFLGILKGDVDYLGGIMSNGIKDLSISRLAALSRSVDLFFSYYLNEEISREYPEIYTVYAGGDDFVYLGPWQTILKFSRQVYDLFREYTCINPHVTLSAAIILAKPRWPMDRIINQAEKLLEECKEQGRDRFGMFDTVVTWKELEDIMKWQHRLDSLLKQKEKPLPYTYLHKLMLYGMMYENRDENPENYMYLPWLSYDLRRKDFNAKAIEVIGELSKLDHGRNQILDYYRIPLSITIYNNRRMKR